VRLRAFIAALCVLVACGRHAPKFEKADIPATVVTTTIPAVSTTAPPATTTTAPKPSAPKALAGAKAVLSPGGIPLTVLAHEPDGSVQVLTPCENTVRISTATAVVPPTVILDPGHGGGEPGAVGYNHLAEKTVNLAVAEATAAALRAAGVTVLLARTGDYRMSLTARARLVTALKPKVFVSIHHNAVPDGPHDGPGSEPYYQVASPATNDQSKRLAGLLYEDIVSTLRPYNVAWVGDTDAGAKYRQGSTGDDYYAMLRQTKGVVAALAELAFISNPPEADLLVQSDFQRAEGDSVARAILRYLRSADPGSGFTTPYARTTPAGGGGKAGCADPPL
jgi:N-acetylmuramoyl-L-alanine amidase